MGKNQDWSRALQALGILMQTPYQIQQIQRQGERQGFQDEYYKMRLEAAKSNVAQQKALDTDVEGMTSPLPDFLRKTSRGQAAQKVLGKTAPRALAKSFLEPQKPQHSFPFRGENMVYDDPNDYMLGIKRALDITKAEEKGKDLFVTLKNGKRMKVEQATYIDYVQGTGDFKPDEVKTPTISQMRTRARTRVNDYISFSLNEDPVAYKKANPQRYNELYNEFGAEDFGSAKWQLTTGKKPMRVTVKKITGFFDFEKDKEQVVDVWNEEDQAEILDAQKLVKNKEMSKEAYQKFLIKLLEVDFGD